MIRFIKKWWILKNLDKAIFDHTNEQPTIKITMGTKVSVIIPFFISGREDLPEYPGLAEKSVYRFSLIFCRKKDIKNKILYLRKKNKNEKKLKKRINEYNRIIEECEKEGFIKIEETKEGQIATFEEKAYKIEGLAGLLQGILSRYSRIWTIIGSIIGIIISFFIGKSIGE